MMSHADDPELSDVYEQVHQEVIWLNTHWQMYEQLFGLEQNVNLFNQLCPFAGRVIQDALWDSILLHISRLCDPASSGKYENASLERLNKELCQRDAEFGLSLNSNLGRIRDDFRSTISHHRDKRIAHSDLASRRANYSLLPAFSRQQIRRLIADISGFMNQIQLYFWDSPTHYDFVAVRGGGESMVSCLKDSARLLELQDLAWSGADNLIEELRKRQW
jgi:hypothetical protein